MGYREFMFDLFGENLLFLDGKYYLLACTLCYGNNANILYTLGDTWQQAREKLERAFDHNSLSQSLEMCKQ